MGLYNKLQSNEGFLFLKQLLKNPKTMGALYPSSQALSDFILKQTHYLDGDYILEIGAGTGSLTKGLISGGIPKEKIIVVELDKKLYNFLKSKILDVNIINADAKHLPNILPKNVIGKISTVVSGIPMMNLSEKEKMAIIDACFLVMKQNGRLIQFTYKPTSPINCEKFNLEKKFLGRVMFNVPPASVWEFTKKENF
jgi:phosphatidylethanolamine/phosphatidyl-N-methylethanolamine N-methyltransferase